jgi:hypothetical protein
VIITLDFETFYSQDYSLSKMSEVDYILSPLFQTILCAIKIDDQAPVVAYGHGKVAQALALLPWDRAALLSHNTRFDGAILSWIYNHRPKFYLDTLSMARALTHATSGLDQPGLFFQSKEIRPPVRKLRRRGADEDLPHDGRGNSGVGEK